MFFTSSLCYNTPSFVVTFLIIINNTSNKVRSSFWVSFFVIGYQVVVPWWLLNCFFVTSSHTICSLLLPPWRFVRTCYVTAMFKDNLYCVGCTHRSNKKKRVHFRCTHFSKTRRYENIWSWMCSTKKNYFFVICCKYILLLSCYL